MKVAVIGGGPSGLATLKFLTTAHHFFPIDPIEARLFEAEADIGGTFAHRVYEDAELVSSKYLTAFSDFRLPLDAPDFVTPRRFVRYLADYARAFGLGRAIQCNARVTRVSRGPGGVGHVLSIARSDGQELAWSCEAVPICSGFHAHPNIPDIPGLEHVPVVLHSSQLKRRAQFGTGTSVVVCGAGETGMDVAHLAMTSPTRSVTLCHRDGFFCAPKIIPTPRRRGQKAPARPNKPVDASVASLFDTAYAHPVLQRSRLLWLAYEQWVKKMHLISGTEEGPDQCKGHMSGARKSLDSIFLCKSDRALPYISEGHRSQSWWNRLRSCILNVPLEDTKGRRIDVMMWPTGVDKQGFMHVPEDGSGGLGPLRRVKADVVILATGYSANFPFLDADYPRLAQADVRGVYQSGHVSVGFIGFVRPAIGAIPPLAEMQAQLWVLRLLQDRFPHQVPRGPGANALASYELDFKLHPRCGYDLFTTKRGVDHEAYAYQLALDMGSAPTMAYVLRKGWRLFFTWAMGSNFNPKFRLTGPWKWEAGAERIMRGELYGVVRWSGGFMYLLAYTVIPLLAFGVVSVALFALCGILGLLAAALPEGARRKLRKKQWIAQLP